jgi:nitroimidazol reductase NimA-like FMN-containing flavoprotein (pyridoxamine 5'-phosphate oxidase superfamily)
VGRVVFTTDHGPEALPVNYTVVGESVVFRTAPDTPLAAVVDTDVGFEVDRLDEAFSEGWSVLVSGPAKRVREPAVIWRLADVVEPWAGGDRNVFIRIDPHRVTGRRIRSGTGDL